MINDNDVIKGGRVTRASLISLFSTASLLKSVFKGKDYTCIVSYWRVLVSGRPKARMTRHGAHLSLLEDLFYGCRLITGENSSFMKQG